MQQSNTSAHPDAGRLAAFHDGLLDEDEIQAIGAHLDSCDGCLTKLKELLPGELTSLVKGAGPPEDAQLPAVLKNQTEYLVLSRLGAGGMGEVYLARHKALNKFVAIKVVRPELLTNANAIERFRREATVLAGLRHPKIVTVHDLKAAKDGCYFIMEFVPGESLAALVKRPDKGKLPVVEACDCALQALQGLEHLHEKGVVHRDIKPHNLIRATAGHIMIVDFGLTKSDEGSEMTGGGATLGTWDYMSPEQFDNAHSADIRSDIYSLGCSLYFLLSGAPPFAAATQLAAKYDAHRSQQPPPLSEVPQDVTVILQKMMAKKPGERYQTPTDAINALEKVLKPTPPIPGPVPEPLPKTLVKLPFWKRPLFIALSALILLIGLGVGLFLGNGGGAGPNSQSVQAGSSPLPRAESSRVISESEAQTTSAGVAFTKGRKIMNDGAVVEQARPHLQEAIRLAKLRTDEHATRAVDMQADLTAAGASFADGSVTNEDRTAILRNWAVNDVGTCWFYQGRAYEYLLQLELVKSSDHPGELAKEYYKHARDTYRRGSVLTHSRCWDPEQMLFWKPADSASDGLVRLREKYANLEEAAFWPYLALVVGGGLILVAGVWVGSKKLRGSKPQS